MSESNKNSKKTVYLIIIFLLLLINLVGAYYLFKGQQDIEAKTEEIVDLKDDLGELQADFNAQLAELEKMKGVNAELDVLLAEREAEIKEHLAEIDKWKKQSSYNVGEVKKLKDKLLEFEEERMSFLAQIDELTEQNAELTELKEQLEVDLASEKETTSILSEEKEYLAGKFELGSLLQADELTANGIKTKDNGVEKEVYKVKNVEKILVCYQTGENKVREKGEVKMQLRLLNPSGETMYLEQEGSGTFTSKENGKELRFTKEASFAYDNSNKKICIYWSHNITQAGMYTAEIYQEGYLVGIKKFELQ
ncbi:MAG: hypothetical protein H6579_08990 [Chitinophagales bacterium]|nr:hypothetical protein [Chitinophagales bacterium]